MLYLWFVIGMVLGVVLTVITLCRKTSYGTFKIDCSNPEKDVYRLDMNSELDTLSKKKRIILKIVNHDDLSRK